MRKKILKEIRLILNKQTSFFIREEDVQLYLAQHFIKSNLFDNVFIEYHIPSYLIKDYPWKDNKKIYIDIVLEKDNKFYPIEIKFKTVTQKLPFLIFGEKINVTLGQHGAQNIGCYDFWKDVKRIELFEKNFNLVQRGIVLFISNDESYQKKPTNPYIGYAQFSIHNNRHIFKNTSLNWNGNLKVSEGRPVINIHYSYDIKWTKMFIEKHYYILI